MYIFKHDVFDSAVVIAKSIEAAQHMIPSQWARRPSGSDYPHWPEPENVVVTKLGCVTADVYEERGERQEVVVASFISG